MTYLQYLGKQFKNHRVQMGLLLISLFIAYLPIFSNSFVWDDMDTIVNWQAKQYWSSIPAFLLGETPPTHPGNYRPIRNIIYIIDHQLFGIHPFGYHLQSLFLVISITLVIHELLRLCIPHDLLPFVVALFFGLHPVHVEALTWMTSSLDMFGVLFLFCSLFFALKSLQKNRFFGPLYLCSLLLSLLAYGTNEVTLSLPFLLMITHFFFFRKNIQFRKLFAFYLPYFTILGLYGIARIFIAEQGARTGYVFGSPHVEFILMCKAFWQYVLVLFFPIRLSINHALGVGVNSWAVEVERVTESVRNQLFSWQANIAVVLSTIASISVLLCVAISQFKKRPVLTFSILWFSISFVPMINLIPTEAIMVERFLFLPSLGFITFWVAIVFELLLQKGKQRDRLGRGILVISVLILLLYGIRTYLRNMDWRNNEVLWSSTISANPNALLARLYLADIYLTRNNIQEALLQYKEVFSRNPDYPGVRVTLGTLYDAVGNHQEAIQTLNSGTMNVALQTTDYVVLANSYRRLEKYELAVQAYLNAIKLSPNDASLYNNLGAIYALTNEYEKAKEAFSKSLQLNPNSESAKQNLQNVDAILRKNGRRSNP